MTPLSFGPSQLLDHLLHIDTVLGSLITSAGPWIYGMLFAVVFCETGLVVTPFLPGDSLLFAAGALAAGQALDPAPLALTLAIAAITGDSVNYGIGRFFGRKLVAADLRFLKREHLDRTHRFYEQHGGKTIVLARFMPIIRTFAPFVAGIGSMDYRLFFLFNVGGGLLWVGAMVGAGYSLGNLPFARQHFSTVILAIIVVSLLPGAVEYLRHRRRE